MLHLTETQKAYLTGLWEGEGSILATIKNDTVREIRISIAMTHHIVIGSMYQLVKLGSTNNNIRSCRGYKICYRWTICNHDAAKLLDLLVPYLIVKRKQAELYIELAGIRALHGTKINQTKQVQLAKEISRLNRSGVVAI